MLASELMERFEGWAAGYPSMLQYQAHINSSQEFLYPRGGIQTSGKESE